MRFLFSVFIFSFLLVENVLSTSPDFLIQDDTVKVPDVAQIPIIDGIGTDACWKLVNWQDIDQVWIEWGTYLPASDFTGRYKAVWSSSTNLLYILLEVTDDEYIDGYIYNSNHSVGGGYPNYDLPEIFIDENRSKGLHVFDGTGQTGKDWGYNAENAFSYHIMVNFPSDGQTTLEFVACDIAGTGWQSYQIANYASHFDHFMVRRAGDTTIWEMALKIYGDDYNPLNPEASRITLTEGKVMGFSMAWCDNDEPDGTRDNFIGSVFVTKDNYNNHWMNADDFGVMQLLGSGPVSNISHSPDLSFDVWYVSDVKEIRFTAVPGSYAINVIDMAGRIQLCQKQRDGSSSGICSIDASHLRPGVYLVRTATTSGSAVRKIVVH